MSDKNPTPMEAAAKAWYRDYEDCSPEFVEKVWGYKLMPHDQIAGRHVDPCARCGFESTVLMARDAAFTVVRAWIDAAMSEQIRDALGIEGHPV